MAKHNGLNDSTGEPYWKRRRKANPDRVRRIERNSALKAKYGISLDDYEQLLEDQGYLCAICGLILTQGLVKNVCVDHCHKTGTVRGILCGKCNKALGLVDDDADTLKAMVEYVTRENSRQRDSRCV